MLESNISFFTEDVDFSLQKKEDVTGWLVSICEKENKSVENIEYIFCSDLFLLEVNKKHLNHDYFTDIITFPLSDDPIEATIFISVDRVKENAMNYEVAFEDELHRVLAHGVLHLIGYNDKTEEDQKSMREKENQVLKTRSF